MSSGQFIDIQLVPIWNRYCEAELLGVNTGDYEFAKRPPADTWKDQTGTYWGNMLGAENVGASYLWANQQQHYQFNVASLRGLSGKMLITKTYLNSGYYTSMDLGVTCSINPSYWGGTTIPFLIWPEHAVGADYSVDANVISGLTATFTFDNVYVPLGATLWNLTLMSSWIRNESAMPTPSVSDIWMYGGETPYEDTNMNASGLLSGGMTLMMAVPE